MPRKLPPPLGKPNSKPAPGSTLGVKPRLGRPPAVELRTEDLPNRVRKLRLARGWTVEKLAEKCGVGASQIFKVEIGKKNGGVPLSDTWRAKLKDIFDVPEAALLTGGPSLVPLSGYVGAGDEIFAFDDEGAIGYRLAPPDVDSDGAAWQVKGDSNAPRYMPGEIVYTSGKMGPGAAMSLLVGSDCVVQVASNEQGQGPRLLKRIERGRKKETLRLYSYASASLGDDVTLEWAAPVIWVRRK